MKTKNLIITLLLLLLVVSATAEIEKGVTINPESSNAIFTIGNNLPINSFKVYSQKIKLNKTNITVQNSQTTNVTIWNHSDIQNKKGLLKYSFNDSAELKLYKMNASLYYRIREDGSFQREVTGQEWINISAPSNTNITVNASTESYNNPPTYSNIQPGDGSEAVKRPPTLSIDVSGGDSIDVTFYNSTDNEIGSETGLSSDDTASTNWNNLDANTTYNWYAEIADGQDTVTTSTYSFTTNQPPQLDPNQQYYDNFSVNHEFEIEAFANDTDGENDIQECQIYYSDSNGNTGTIEGNIYTSYGASIDVKCAKNLSNSISGIEVGEKLTTETRFYDGGKWANTSQDSNTVQNNPPTKPTSKTDLKDYLADETPGISWMGEDDPDGDSMTVKAYTGTTTNPTTLDNSADSTAESMELGQNVNLQDNKTYYYRLKVCDKYGKCSSYTSSDSFLMNEEPNIKDHGLNKTDPVQGDTIQVETNVEDSNLQSVNFTAWKENTKVIDNQNGTLESGKWISPEIKLDQKTSYNYTITAEDNSSETSTATENFDLGYKSSGKYTETYTTTKQVTELKTTYHGELNDGEIQLKANTSQSNKVQLENNTWKEITSGEDIKLEFELSTDNTSKTPRISNYELYYRTDPKTPGYIRTTIKDFGNPAKIDEFRVNETQPEGTNATYQLRTGPENTVTENWSDWKLCLNTCQPDLPENRYLQYRVNLSTTNNKAPEINNIEVNH